MSSGEPRSVLLEGTYHGPLPRSIASARASTDTVSACASLALPTAWYTIPKHAALGLCVGSARNIEVDQRGSRGGVFPNVFGDAHRTEFRSAHAAERSGLE